MNGDPGRLPVSSLMLEEPDIYTVASGVVTIEQGFAVINGEGAANDDIVTITPGTKLTKTSYGQVIYITAKIGQTHLVKHNTGNILCNTGADISLTENKVVMLVKFVTTTTANVNNKWRAIG